VQTWQFSRTAAPGSSAEEIAALTNLSARPSSALPSPANRQGTYQGKLFHLSGLSHLFNVRSSSSVALSPPSLSFSHFQAASTSERSKYSKRNPSN